MTLAIFDGSGRRGKAGRKTIDNRVNELTFLLIYHLLYYLWKNIQRISRHLDHSVCAYCVATVLYQ